MIEVLTFKIQFVTPAFVGGANPKEICELSASSLKGLLRYWWRFTSFSNETNKDCLLKEETKIFGSTEKIAIFKIRVENDSLQLNQVDESFNDFYFNSVLFADEKNDRLAMKYLTFSVEKSRNHWFKPASTFTMKLIFSKHASKEHIESILMAMWLLERFGGIGARVRRGFGSIKILSMESKKQSNYSIPPFLFQLDVPSKEISNSTKKGLKSINKNLLDEMGFRFVIHPMQYDYSSEAIINIGKTLIAIRRNIEAFSKEPSMLHGLIDDPKNNKILPSTIFKSTLGLPIIYNFRRRDENGNPLKGPNSLEDKKINLSLRQNDPKDPPSRKASPIIFRVLCVENKYYVLAAFLPQILIDYDRDLHLDIKKKTTNNNNEKKEISIQKYTLPQPKKDEAKKIYDDVYKLINNIWTIK